MATSRLISALRRSKGKTIEALEQAGEDIQAVLEALRQPDTHRLSPAFLNRAGKAHSTLSRVLSLQQHARGMEEAVSIMQSKDD